MGGETVWRVYVEVRTSSLQDAESLQWLVSGMHARDEVISAEPAAASRGTNYSLTARILLRAVGAEAARTQALAIFHHACAAAGFSLGKVMLVEAEPVGPTTIH